MRSECTHADACVPMTITITCVYVLKLIHFLIGPAAARMHVTVRPLQRFLGFNHQRLQPLVQAARVERDIFFDVAHCGAQRSQVRLNLRY